MNEPERHFLNPKGNVTYRWISPRSERIFFCRSRCEALGLRERRGLGNARHRRRVRFLIERTKSI
jgi:hypothetical protein